MISMSAEFFKAQLANIYADATKQYAEEEIEITACRKKLDELLTQHDDLLHFISAQYVPDVDDDEPYEPENLTTREIIQSNAEYTIMQTDFDAYEANGPATCKTEKSRIPLRQCLKWVKTVVQEPTTWDETMLEIYEAYESEDGNLPSQSSMRRFFMNLIKYLRTIRCQIDYDLMKTKIDQHVASEKETQITRMNKVNYTFDDIRNTVAIEPVDKLLLKLYGDSPNYNNRFPILRPDELAKCVVVESGETPPIDMNYIQDGILYNNVNKEKVPYSFKIESELLKYFPSSGPVFGTTNRNFPCRRLKKLTGNNTVTCRDLRQLQCYEHRNKPYAFQVHLAELLGHKFSIHKECYDHLQYEPKS